MYGHVTGSTVDALGNPPRVAYDGARWWDLRTLDPAALAATGWFLVTEVARPADTATNTTDATYVKSGSVILQSWTTRTKTAQEVIDATAAANSSTIETNLNADLVTLQAMIDATNATINANAAVYIKDLARVQRRIVRRVINKLDGVS